MSAFTAIRAVSRRLKVRLQEHITHSPDIDVNGVQIDFRSPRELTGSTNMLSLWLYLVERNPDVLNHRPPPVARDRIAHPGLPVNLHFLVTPMTGDPESNHAVLGKVLQVFNDYPVLDGLDDTGAPGEFETARLTLQPLSLEALTRVWDALKEPYRLSMAYLAQAVMIPSGRAPKSIAPVTSKVTRHGQV